jgi:NADPH-dependent ferric siderophore reductase
MSEIDTYEPKYQVAGVCEVVRTAHLTPHMRRITFHGAALEGLDRYWRPEMLARLYFPPKGHRNPAEPFLTPSGDLDFHTASENEVSPFSAYSEDPLVRAYTARQFKSDMLELDIDFALHETPGLASDWARDAKVGDRIGIVIFALPSGHSPATAHIADIYLLFADEAALPSAQTNLESFAPGTKVIAFFEVADEFEEQAINTQADLTVTWLHRGEAKAGTSGLLTQAIRELTWPKGRVFVWACGEMKTVAEIRRFIREERDLKKGDYKCQAYWRLGKTEVERMARMTDLAMAAAETNPEAFQESFEEIGMNIEDPTLFSEPALTGSGRDVEANPSILQESLKTRVNNEESTLVSQPGLIRGEASRSADDGANKSITVDGTWVISIKSPLGAQVVTLRFSTQGSRFTGTMESKLGSGAISDGMVVGHTLTWTSTIERPRRAKLEFNANIDGDSISGIAKMGAFIQTTFKGIRK